MARQAALNDFAAKRIERCKERRGSVATVVVRLTSQDALAEWQDRGSAFKSLSAALFIDAENESISRRCHGELHNVPQLLNKIGIC